MSGFIIKGGGSDVLFGLKRGQDIFRVILVLKGQCGGAVGGDDFPDRGELVECVACRKVRNS